MKKYFLINIIVLFILSACGLSEESSETKDYQDVTVEEARNLIKDSKVKVIDVRTKEEFAQGHIPDAVLIPLQELEERLLELNKDEHYLIVCRSGNRSAQASTILVEHDFNHIDNMLGGMIEWNKTIEK